MGRRFGSAPASIAPRSPARRGTQARRAPEVALSRRTAESAPREAASRSPTRMIVPGCASASVTGEDPEIRSPSASASAPGSVRISSPPILARPAPANGASEKTLRPRLRQALRSRRKTIGDSSSGSNPASSTAGAFSRSA